MVLVKKRLTRAAAKKSGQQPGPMMRDEKKDRDDCKTALKNAALRAPAGSKERRDLYRNEPNVKKCRKMIMPKDSTADYPAVRIYKRHGKRQTVAYHAQIIYKSRPKPYDKKPLTAEHKAKISKTAKKNAKMNKLKRAFAQSGPAEYKLKYKR